LAVVVLVTLEEDSDVLDRVLGVGGDEVDLDSVVEDRGWRYCELNSAG
jgi:hypothetical protein